MGDSYKHIPDDVAVYINTLREYVEQYKDKIDELNGLVIKIDGSAEWKDLQVKSAFIATCNSYITLYRTLVATMERYVNYLSKKSEGASALEKAYAG